jgi:hypothetical protein
MNLIIDCSLSEPPSEISCFRDITLFSKVYCFEDVLLSCPKGTRSSYWSWLKKNGAHDYITYLLTYSDNEDGISMHPEYGDIVVKRINSFNLNEVIRFLKRYKVR